MTNLQNMTLDQLYEERKKYEYLLAQYDAKQQALKIVSNSCYGAIGNSFYRWFSTTVATSITQSGQLSIRYIIKHVNDYLNALLKTEGEEYVVYADTDSVVGDSELIVNGERIRIDNLFNQAGKYLKRDDFNQDYVRELKDTHTFSVNDEGELEERRAKYVMKHRVQKRMYAIEVDGRTVHVTEDHSVIVKRMGRLKSVKPTEIQPNDILITLDP